MPYVFERIEGEVKRYKNTLDELHLCWPKTILAKQKSENNVDSTPCHRERADKDYVVSLML